MARRKRTHPPNPSASPIVIGNCKVEIEGSGSTARREQEPDSVTISVSDAARIKISVDRPGDATAEEDRTAGDITDGTGDFSILLVNPKDIGSGNDSLLQEILQVYKDELPSMNFAANTGKKSQFLERCVSIGKYKTLIIRSNPMNRHGEVIAAVSFQLVPADTQFAEIPLAAVKSTYQNKGFGRYLVEELKRRLQNVGVNTIFCWADEASEGFWLKQMFKSMGVDIKRRGRRLPIKAEIRRSLCFPGGATLMAAHLSTSDFPAYFTGKELVQKKACPVGLYQNESEVSGRISQNGSGNRQNTENYVPPILEEANPAKERLDVASGETDLKSTSGFLLGNLRYRKDLTLGGSKSPSVDCEDCLSSGQCLKRRVWGSSVYSLKSKRIRGSVCGHCSSEMDKELPGSSDRDMLSCDESGKAGVRSGNGILVETTLRTCSIYCSTSNVDVGLDRNVVCNESLYELPTSGYPRIMLMDIADEIKKMNLTKIVESLGGSVTTSGCVCTHVITGKARRTLNFCVALCSGALVVSSKWLKDSYKEGKFLDGLHFLLEDVEYALKYKSGLKEAVLKAQKKPHGLLKDYQICIAKHVRPPLGIVSEIVKSAGGTVIPKLDDVRDSSKTIFLASEEDMDEAFAAAKHGVWTYSSEWFMNCIMKQELDFEAPQFAESL